MHQNNIVIVDGNVFIVQAELNVYSDSYDDS